MNPDLINSLLVASFFPFPKYNISFYHLPIPQVERKGLFLGSEEDYLLSGAPEHGTLQSECGNTILVRKWMLPTNLLGCVDVVVHFAKPGYQTQDLAKWTKNKTSGLHNELQEWNTQVQPGTTPRTFPIKGCCCPEYTYPKCLWLLCVFAHFWTCYHLFWITDFYFSHFIWSSNSY